MSPLLVWCSNIKLRYGQLYTIDQCYQKQLKNICFTIASQSKERTTKHLWDHYVERKIFRKTNISYSLVWTRTCAFQGARNDSFSENFAYALNEWSIWWRFWRKNVCTKSSSIHVWLVPKYVHVTLNENILHTTWFIEKLYQKSLLWPILQIFFL